MRSLRPSLILFVVGLAALIGCRQDDEIQKQIMTHADREPFRLRVAMIEHDKLVWFFLLKGPEALVNKNVDTFNELVRSVRFDSKKDPISFTEPKSWKKDPPSEKPERYAAFRIDAKPKELEVTVTMFPAAKFNELENVRRWQKQVNQEQTEDVKDLADKKIVQSEMIGKQEIRWVDLTGVGVHMPSKPPDPLAMANQKKFNMPFEVKQGAGKLPFKFEVPDGWQKGKLRGDFMVERYEMGDGVEVAFTPFKGNGGGVAMNVNRWRKEVKLADLPPEEAERTGTWIDVAGKKSFLVDIANPDGPPGKNRSIAVIVPLGSDTWFIKMHGPIDQVGQHKNAFEDFVKSFKMDAR